MINARQLADIPVLDLDGQEVRLGDLWSHRPAILVWLRHYGCVFCQEQTAEFLKRRADIERRGAALAFVGNGSPRFARGFRDEYCPGCTVLTDPRLDSYRAIGARSGLLNTLGPQAWGSALRAFRRGARQRGVQGHAFQQGGVLVVAPGDRLLYSHLSSAAGDHPSLDAILAAIPAARRAEAGRVSHAQGVA